MQISAEFASNLTTNIKLSKPFIDAVNEELLQYSQTE